VFVLDAGALDTLADTKVLAGVVEHARTSTCIVTPHAGEMARMMNTTKEAVEQDASDFALKFATTRQVVVALKGATTYIATPGRDLWIHENDDSGLATSDPVTLLAGVIAGLAARGTDSARAAVWGVALHAMAGAALSRRHGALGMLAREISHQIPALMHRLTSTS
jgi:NAD(P)H-hydrate repair Nnr-like enzyme with NAD(P)H-hydrate dehydratase domain